MDNSDLPKRLVPLPQAVNKRKIKTMAYWCIGCLVIGLFAAVLPKDQQLRLWQLPAQGKHHMMSYVLKDSDNNLFVVDGGTRKDASFLKDFLFRQGGKVTGWLITHPHDDHVGALTKILNNPQGLEIKAVYGSFLEEDFIRDCQPRRLDDFLELTEALDVSKVPFHQTRPGMRIGTRLLQIEVLSDSNPDIVFNCMNNSSIVYRVSDAFTSVVFLGDLGVRGGEKLLNGLFADRLPANIVQMAHHGQRGVDFEFYERLQPSICLWPTPRWLGQNNGGKGYDTGPWDTIRVRDWMDQLGVTEHYLMADGLLEIK